MDPTQLQPCPQPRAFLWNSGAPVLGSNSLSYSSWRPRRQVWIPAVLLLDRASFQAWELGSMAAFVVKGAFITGSWNKLGLEGTVLII